MNKHIGKRQLKNTTAEQHYSQQIKQQKKTKTQIEKKKDKKTKITKIKLQTSKRSIYDKTIIKRVWI